MYVTYALYKLAFVPKDYLIPQHIFPMANKFSVINPSYCAPKALSLQINTKKGIAYDVKGNRVFYIKDTLFTFHGRRVLCDDKGSPIVTLYKKVCY